MVTRSRIFFENREQNGIETVGFGAKTGRRRGPAGTSRTGRKPAQPGALAQKGKGNRERLPLDTGGWGSIERCLGTRMNPSSSIPRMIELLEELLHGKITNFV